jgi:hypothetical protein
MNDYRFARRSFLRGVGGSLALRAFLRQAEAAAAGARAPTRFMVLHHPVGTVRAHWLCSGSDAEFELSRILKPFAPVQSNMVILDGLRLTGPGPGGAHEKGTVLLMTGQPTKRLYPGNGGDDVYAEGPSIDQIFLRRCPALQQSAIASLQLSCDDRVDEAEWSTRRLSYTGPGAPLTPYLAPHLAYDRLFGSAMPGGLTASNMEALARARAVRRSVLDFGLRDLARLRKLVSAQQRPRLDAHGEAIRDLEKELDRAVVDPAGCGTEGRPPVHTAIADDGRPKGDHYNNPVAPGGGDDARHEQIGRLHFGVVRAAFRCDLTRVVTFQWSPGTNHVSFKGLWPGDPTVVRMHHPTSHQSGPEVTEYLARVDEWYSVRVAAFIRSLKETHDADGNSLLDTTLIPYVTEVASGDHGRDNVPVVLFGGPGVGITRGLFGRYRRRPMNDMWLDCARRLGVEGLTSLGTRDMYSGPLEGAL